MNNEHVTETDRRTYLKVLAAAGTVGSGSVAGCLGIGSDESGPLEVLQPWTGGGGKKAINAVIDGFEAKYPEMETDFNAVGATANVQLNSLVNQRLSNQNPPSSFNAWPGAHLRPFVSGDNNVLGDITESVWSHNNMKEAFLQEAQELSKFDGQYVCVPIGSHRLNNLFYNVSVVEEASVDPESIETPADLVPALEAVSEQTDAAGMSQSMTNANTMLQLWAATHLGTHGYDAYMELVGGNGDTDRVTESLEITKKYAQQFNEDAATVAPPQANQKIMNGDAAFLHQGNWMAGGYKANDLKYEEDWGWIAFPGTSNMYTLHFDAFVQPASNPSPEKAAKWHRYLGSKEAQVTFNKHKGSIPARTDVSTEEFGPFLTETMEDFANVEHKPPTLAHGLAVPPETLVNLRKVINNNFMGPYDVAPTAQGIIDTIGA